MFCRFLFSQKLDLYRIAESYMGHEHGELTSITDQTHYDAATLGWNFNRLWKLALQGIALFISLYNPIVFYVYSAFNSL